MRLYPCEVTAPMPSGLSGAELPATMVLAMVRLLVALKPPPLLVGA